jgi:hypothetical protein
MFIDYIYLILILTLLGSILFLIYLSYEYRINEGFSSSMYIPDINTDAIYNLAENINPVNNDYNVFINDINNTIQYKHNMTNKQLLENAKDNLVKSKALEDLKIGSNNRLNNTIFPPNEIIKTIKSKYNSQYLSIFANDRKNYGVLVNDKCLTVNGLCKEDFCLLDCQKNLYTSDSQKFASKRIYTDNDVANIMNLPISEVSSKNVYPFNIFTSAVNNNCLTINDNGITVEKCNLNNIKQQWAISPDENICVLK